VTYKCKTKVRHIFVRKNKYLKNTECVEMAVAFYEEAVDEFYFDEVEKFS